MDNISKSDSYIQRCHDLGLFTGSYEFCFKTTAFFYNNCPYSIDLLLEDHNAYTYLSLI